MPRIKLSSWYGDHAPGDEIDVDEAQLKALTRDGRVAEAVGFGNGGALEPGPSVAVNETGEPEAVEPAPPESGRRKR
jgi:hypothetical protein